MTNKLKYLLILLSIVLSGCLNKDFDPESWAVDPDLSFSNSIIVFNSTLSSDTVAVFTNYASFKATSSQDWCKVIIDDSKKIIIIKSEPNLDIKQRSAIITVTIERGNKLLSKDVSVVQMGGVWEAVGNFNLYWGYEIGQTQKDAIVGLLNSMVYVPEGSFVMGQTDSEIVDGAKPHKVTLSPYYISTFELSQEQWNVLMGSNPSLYKSPNLPVYNISWNDALEYVTRLSTLTNLDVRLPSEAQWEYAARGAHLSNGFTYAGSDDFEEIADVDDSYTIPFPSGQKKPNELGLYDMSGNVSEYCFDWYERDYIGETDTDPIGPDSGTQKCVRGGNISCRTYKYHLRTTNRCFFNNIDGASGVLTGFRIVIIP